MKKYFLLLALLLFCLVFASCENKGEGSAQNVSSLSSSENYTFTAKVKEAKEDHILVEVTEDGGNATPKGTEISISLKSLGDSAPKLKKGDKAKVECDGIFLETYPLMLSELYSVSKIN